MKTLLITGSTGVLAKKFISEYGHLYNIIEAKRNPISSSDLTLSSWVMDAPKTHVDLVIHFAGKYLVDDSLASINSVFDAVVGTAASVADFCARNKTPLIALGSYFEKAPEELYPWSYYASAKKAAFELLELSAKDNGYSFTYIYCYDTYGEDTSRRKIIDVLLDPTIKTLELSEGMQRMNLTHTTDFASAVQNAIKSVLSGNNIIVKFQLRNSLDEFTLKEIVEIINEIRRNKIEVKFGVKSYRKKEVFSVWDCAPNVPEWSPEISFKTFVKDFTRNSDAE